MKQSVKCEHSNPLCDDCYEEFTGKPRSQRTPKATRDSTEALQEAELTFEQQVEITKILENYRSNPSNSNKFRYELFALVSNYIAKACNDRADEAAKRASGYEDREVIS